MIEYKPFDEKYVSKIKDIMIDIILSEYRCQTWGQSAYMMDWKTWILDQKYDFYKFFPSCLKLVFDDNKLVGFGSIKKEDAKTAEIKKIYLLKSYRSRGIGQQVFDALMNEAKKLNGVNMVQCYVCVPFIEAVNFYEKNGFEITYLDPMKLEYKMERKLSV